MSKHFNYLTKCSKELKLLQQLNKKTNVNNENSQEESEKINFELNEELKKTLGEISICKAANFVLLSADTTQKVISSTQYSNHKIFT